MAMNKLSPKSVLVLVAGLALLAALALWATRQRAASQPAATGKPTFCSLVLAVGCRILVHS